MRNHDVQNRNKKKGVKEDGVDMQGAELGKKQLRQLNNVYRSVNPTEVLSRDMTRERTTYCWCVPIHVDERKTKKM